MTTDAAVRAALDALECHQGCTGETTISLAAMSGALRAADAERAKGADGVVSELMDAEAAEREIARDCDCLPEHTSNWHRAESIADAAALILSLRAENARLREAEAGMRDRAAQMSGDVMQWAINGRDIASAIRALPLTGDDA